MNTHSWLLLESKLPPCKNTKQNPDVYEEDASLGIMGSSLGFYWLFLKVPLAYFKYQL